MAYETLKMSRQCWLAVASILVMACSEATNESGVAAVAAAKVENLNSQGAESEHTVEIPRIRAVDLKIEAGGALRPGLPIQIVATATANRPASEVNIELRLLDDDQLIRPASISSTRALERWKGSIDLTARRTLSGTVMFNRPGYYRVQVGAQVVLRAPNMRADTMVMTSATETVWLLVDEGGGRITDGFDPSVVDSMRMPLFGSYGAFVPRASKLPGNRSQVGGPSDASTSALTDVWMDGWLEYHDTDVGNYVRLPGALVEAQCLNWDLDPIAYYTTRTNESGAYAVQCPVGTEYMEGSITFNDSYSDSRGPGGAVAGGSFQGTDGSTGVVVRAGNDYAAKAFRTITEKAPVAMSRFGYSRGQIDVWVSSSSYSYGVYYCSLTGPTCAQADVIYTNYSIVFGEQGSFSVMHEYGHGFHYVALEPWNAYSCTGDPPSHGWTEQENLSCAFVEGFADFFSMWVAGDKIVNQPFGGDPDLESNPNRTVGDGVRIESTIASFLYDLVDGANEPDSPSNTANGDEAFDSVAYSANWIAKAIRYCSLTGGPTRLDGADQLVYCLEGNTNARTESTRWSSMWRSYTGVSYDQSIGTPAGSGPQVRKFWKYNMYGVLEQ